MRCLEDARVALDSIQRGVAETPTPESCRSLLAALQDVSYEGVCDSLYLRDSRTGKERSALACGEAVLAALTDGHAPRVACHA